MERLGCSLASLTFKTSLLKGYWCQGAACLNLSGRKAGRMTFEFLFSILAGGPLSEVLAAIGRTGA